MTGRDQVSPSAQTVSRRHIHRDPRRPPRSRTLGGRTLGPADEARPFWPAEDVPLVSCGRGLACLARGTRHVGPGWYRSRALKLFRPLPAGRLTAVTGVCRKGSELVPGMVRLPVRALRPECVREGRHGSRDWALRHADEADCHQEPFFVVGGTPPLPGPRNRSSSMARKASTPRIVAYSGQSWV